MLFNAVLILAAQIDLDACAEWIYFTLFKAKTVEGRQLTHVASIVEDGVVEVGAGLCNVLSLRMCPRIVKRGNQGLGTTNCTVLGPEKCAPCQSCQQCHHQQMQSRMALMTMGIQKCKQLEQGACALCTTARNGYC